jgi:hypothetical protein
MNVVTMPRFAVPLWFCRSPTTQVVPPPTSKSVPTAAKTLGPAYVRAQPVAKQPASARAIAARQAFRGWFTTSKIADIVRLVHCADRDLGLGILPPTASEKTRVDPLVSCRA